MLTWKKVADQYFRSERIIVVTINWSATQDQQQTMTPSVPACNVTRAKQSIAFVLLTKTTIVRLTRPKLDSYVVRCRRNIMSMDNFEKDLKIYWTVSKIIEIFSFWSLSKVSRTLWTNLWRFPVDFAAILNVCESFETFSNSSVHIWRISWD